MSKRQERRKWNNFNNES